MNLFILSIYDGGYGATMFENGFMVDLTTVANRLAFMRRFGEMPEQVSMSDLQNVIPPDTKIVLCVDGDIEVTDGLVREDAEEHVK